MAFWKHIKRLIRVSDTAEIFIYLEVLVAVWVVHLVFNSDGISKMPLVFFVVVELLKELVAHFARVVLPSKNSGDFSLNFLRFVFLLSFKPTLSCKFKFLV